MKSLKQGLIFVVLTPLLCIFTYPLIWLFGACFKTNREIYQPNILFPEKWDSSHFSTLFQGEVIDFWSLWGNSLLTTLSQSVVAVLLSSMAAYAFVFKDFRYKRLLFIIAVALILIPKQIMIFPLREQIFSMNLNDNLLAVILPGALSGIGVLFFIQIYRHLPEEFIHMAKIEGAGDFRAYLSTLPLIISPIFCCFMIHFIMAWQQHLMPLMLLDQNQLLPVAMSSLLTSSLGYPLAVLMCSAVMCILPSIILFLVSFKNFRSALSEHVC